MLKIVPHLFHVLLLPVLSDIMRHFSGSGYNAESVGLVTYGDQGVGEL